MDTEPGDPSGDEGVGHGVCCYVSDGGSLGPTCEAIHAGEDVAVTCRGWQRTDEVDVNVLESLRDGREGARWRVSVARHLGSLTFGAGASSQSDVLVDRLPDKPRGHHVL